MKAKEHSISEKLEDYILTIFRLTKEHGHAHLSAVADLRGVKNSSANAALNSLQEKGFVVYEKYRPILLTDKGTEMAMKMQERRETLISFFVDTLGVDEKEAKSTVCKVEHLFEDNIITKLGNFANLTRKLKTAK
jgi:Mn-dependent transcriptional regulator